MKADVDDESPHLASWVPVYAGADWHERECWEMFGISFDGHPDLSRILMPEDWIGHPLRKDYEVGDIPVQFKEADRRPPPSRQEASS